MKLVFGFLHVEGENMTSLGGQIAALAPLAPLSSPEQGCLFQSITWVKLSLINSQGELSKKLNLLIFVVNH